MHPENIPITWRVVPPLIPWHVLRGVLQKDELLSQSEIVLRVKCVKGSSFVST